MSGSERVEIEREELFLLPEGAIYWPAQSALLAADLHIGKGAAFRVDGMPLPAGSSEATLRRIGCLLDSYHPDKLYILGDFWHAKQGRTERIHDLLSAWRRSHPKLAMTLVEGNHDRRSGELPADLEIQTFRDLHIGPFVLRHHPEEDERGYVLAGHIHPAVRLIGGGRQVERLPAFWFGPRVGVLPSFGEFTGSATVYPSPGDQVFIIAGDHVMRVGLTGAGV